MIVLPNYQILSQIYESANSLVYRGRREQDNLSVILKVLKQDYPTSAEFIRYRQEYHITSCLNLENVIQAYSLENYHNTLVIIFEDLDGNSLDRWFKIRQFTIEEFLKIAIKITQGLGAIHRANIIHKDLNSSNIIFNLQTGQLKIIDFGISTVLPRENPTIKNPNVLEGTLAYISPEQTGRMNRSLDYRTDFYSLGATFYELLTQKLPFETNDSMELVHCHLAKQPIAVREINSEVPETVSNQVMKLLAKNAEARYQSAWGLKADLEKCLSQLQNNQRIFHFQLASQDVSDKFQIPQKLYGREREIDTLLAAFERVAGRGDGETGRRGDGEIWEQGKNSQSEMLLVSGFSGIGKSALVREIYQPITAARGYFFAGKFDQYHRDLPYSGIIQAFQELVRYLLTENEATLSQWREKILDALGVNAQVIIDVMPEVELIAGKQPDVPLLPPQQAQNRLNLAVVNFIKVFAQPEHPLVIFLDDLQWADSASLQILPMLMSVSALKYLFVIGAYRDNEVNCRFLKRFS